MIEKLLTPDDSQGFRDQVGMIAIFQKLQVLR